ncbi:hypothetical protein I6N96_09040 [Enterococcus sp. BWM-S5]|uniref:Replication-associated protein ORF2/G2P domain-containing protein n=1 Tax=Enterococcus larvae TaxID=2794352 RepID=A0ABS4CIH0_9ENTE|nr:hypothetical protein [Enterococcus larvae]MBP1046428.1 hypothetical protein [Enterococcus larvae]
MSFIRERTIETGNYVEIDLIPRTAAAEIAVKKSRKRKKEVCRPAQQNLNDKNSRRHLLWLFQGNFKKGDIYLTLTYKPKYKPLTIEQAKKDMENYLEKLRYQAKKEKSPPIKYIYITEFSEDEETKAIKNIHHHIIIKNTLTMITLDSSWSKGRGKKKESIGIVHMSIVKTGDEGIAALATYFTKQSRWKKGKRRWSASRNLNRPFLSKDDHDKDYSKRKIEALAISNDGGEEFFRRKYKNYRITHIECKYYELTGWHIYLRAWRDSGDDEGSKG